MMFAPLDQRDPRLRQTCATLTKRQLRDRQQQLEIDALLGAVLNGAHGASSKRAFTSKGMPKTVGLSACQVGIMKQICVVDLSVGKKGYRDLYVLVNPQIITWSRVLTHRAEGCVNFPATWGITRRSRQVTVGGWDRSGNDIKLGVSGWPAVLLQHEVDHLNGRLFIDRLPDPSKAHLVKASEYEEYHKARPESWTHYIDVSMEAVPLPANFQPGHDFEEKP